MTGASPKSLTRNMHLKFYYTLKLFQNKTLRYFTSTHQNDAMPRFSKALFYCTFNVHDEVLMHNPGLMHAQWKDLNRLRLIISLKN